MKDADSDAEGSRGLYTMKAFGQLLRSWWLIARYSVRRQENEVCEVDEVDERCVEECAHEKHGKLRPQQALIGWSSGRAAHASSIMSRAKWMSWCVFLNFWRFDSELISKLSKP